MVCMMILGVFAGAAVIACGLIAGIYAQEKLRQPRIKFQTTRKQKVVTERIQDYRLPQPQVVREAMVEKATAKAQAIYDTEPTVCGVCGAVYNNGDRKCKCGKQTKPLLDWSEGADEDWSNG